MSNRISFLAAASAFLAFGTSIASTSANTTVDIVATNWKFTPNTIVLHVGRTTTLSLTSKEGVHGLQSDDLGIPLTPIASGSVKTVDVTPKKLGTYVLHCAIMCGAGHTNMTLTVHVVQ